MDILYHNPVYNATDFLKIYIFTEIPIGYEQVSEELVQMVNPLALQRRKLKRLLFHKSIFIIKIKILCVDSELKLW